MPDQWKEIMGKKILRNEKGTSIVEFALVLPLLIMLIFGMVEFSILFFDKSVITNASREGARAGIVFNSDPATGAYTPLNDTQIQNIVNSYLGSHLITFGATTAADFPVCNPCTASGAYLTLQVRYRYTFLLLPNFLNFLTSPFTLTAETIMRCE